MKRLQVSRRIVVVLYLVLLAIAPAKVAAVNFAGQQTSPTEWTYTLTFAPFDNYSIFQANTTITLTGLFGVTGAAGPTSTDFPAPHIDEINTNWTAEVFDNGTIVRWTHVGPGTGNFETEQHVFGFRVYAIGATNGRGFFSTSGFSRDTGRSLPNGTFDLDTSGVTAGPVSPCTTVLTVTTTSDSGPGSLRAAILEANTCPGANVIEFASSARGRILLTSGELSIDGDLVISGPGSADLAVDGNRASHVFHVRPGGNVTIAGLTVTNGSAIGSLPQFLGGGILNHHATLTVSNCLIAGNAAPFGNGGGIYNFGSAGHATLHVVDSRLSGNSAGEGGAIFNDATANGTATVHIVNSTFSGNYPGTIFNEGISGSASVRIVGSTLTEGGGIRNSRGTLEIVNSTINVNGIANDASGSGHASLRVVSSMLLNRSRIGSVATYSGSADAEIVNSTLAGGSAMFAGGALVNEGQFGATARLRILNSTLSGNTAPIGGALYNHAVSGGTARVHVVNSTFSGNSATHGGAIHNSAGNLGVAMIEIGSTILNAGPSGANIINRDDGTITSLGYNLSSDDGGGLLTAPGDLINTDPMLGPLQDNGGPTLTHAFVCRSPAIDAGRNFTSSATDQRGTGFARIFDDLGTANASGGDGADIGAFEAQQVLPLCDPAEAIEMLLATLENATLDRRNKRAFIVSLKSAIAALERGDHPPAINQLQAFQNKVRAQIAATDPALAQQLIDGAQAIIDALQRL